MDRGGGPGAVGVRRAPRTTLSWLERELEEWQAQGRVDGATAAGIRALYVPVDDLRDRAARRLSLGRLVLGVGGCFVGVGLLWLVAANLDQMSPGTRFTGVVVLWLAAVLAGELLAVRRGPDTSEAGDDARSHDAVVAAARVIAVLAFGAVVFQAAQSLQVPAWSSALLGFWAAGALVHAYLFSAVAPLVVGIATGTGWCVWAVAERLPAVQGVALALLVAACLATAAAVAHAVRGSTGFARPWRTSGALLALTGLFLAALPREQDAGALPAELWLGAAAVLLAVAGVAVLADPPGRAELGAVVAVLLVALLVVRWQPPGPATSADLSGEALLRAGVAIVLYLLAALWFAALGVLRDSDALTRLATAALVVFTVVQSFAVFEPILSGAALFLVLGAVLVATGCAVDRGRRRLVADVKEVVA